MSGTGDEVGAAAEVIRGGLSEKKQLGKFGTQERRTASAGVERTSATGRTALRLCTTLARRWGWERGGGERRRRRSSIFRGGGRSGSARTFRYGNPVADWNDGKSKRVAAEW